MRHAPPAAATAAEPQPQPVVSERIQPNPDHFGNVLLQCTTIGVCCIASNGICVGPSPHAIPRPDRTLPLSGLFFGCLIRIYGRHVTIRSPGRWPDTARSAAQPSELRYPPIPSNAPAFTRSGAARQAFMTPERRAAGQRPGLRIFTGPLGLGSIDQRIRMHDRGGYRASGRTICTRLNSVLPGSSHGTMCAECSNHTACL